MDHIHERIPVLILDDQLVQREGVANVIASTGAMDVVAKVGDKDAAIRALHESAVRLAFVDLVLKDDYGTQIGREMRRLRPELQVVIYTHEKSMVLAAEIFHESKAQKESALQGYILTSNITSSDYIRRVYAHITRKGYYIDPDILRWHYQMAAIEPLTPREEQCALMVANGQGNLEIAERMQISRRRVENIINVLYLKFHIYGNPGDPGRRVLLAEGVKLLYSTRMARRKFRVIIIDDQEEHRGYIYRILANHQDFEIVAEAESGKAGIALALEKKPDLALVDMRLPDVDGFQVARAIRDALPLAKIIMSSSDSSELYHEAAMRAGADAFFSKFRLDIPAIAEICSPSGA